MGAIVIAINAVLRFITGAKVLSFTFFTWVSSNFITFFVSIQLIVWIGSALFTILLAFFATDIISGIFDMIGLKTYIASLLNNVFDFGSAYDSLGFGNAFGTGLESALIYFNFYDFLNLLISIWFGIFALKMNIMMYRATRFSSKTAGLGSLLGGYKGPGS